ncbi:FAD-dependent oxidoreductase [Bordetella genomosp. 13]|uniref:FAD-binding dehydrogenase n=1 Tax=Bordetella genomosp. 13 TaxID=463040 RepID=A0A1W6ZEV7_9BORD|nr:FAD-binding protein [Bordetella genomosp. 13]ARP95680.1 FAD-binding dehydrogenase [Bordetella genomosp. 13]
MAIVSSDSVVPDAEFDVLVIGAGGCGLAAAVAAHDAGDGVSVAVVEKAERLQGNTMLSSGSIPAAGTRMQRQAGLADSPADFVEDLQRIAGPHEMPALTARLAGISAELVEWLVDAAGVELTLVETYKHIGHRQYRLHSPPSRRGADLMDDLARALDARGIPLAFGNPAVELLAGPDGAVQGAITRTPDGVRTVIAARAVVLASNGFGANRPLLARFCPELAAAPYGGSTGSEGEAVVWGEALGASLANMGAYQAHASLADPHGSLVTWTVVEKGGVVVDAQGRRFGDESMGYSAFAALELDRAGPFYVVADTRVRDLTAAGQEEYAELVAHNGVLQADDAHALAARLGLPGDALADTLSAAAAAARGEAEDPHGRTHWGLGALQAPYTATRIGPALFHTQGGLRVDDDGRVLRADGSAVPGLYAGGGAAAGISGNQGSTGYMSGNGLLSALGLGYLAGRAAVRDMRAA